MFVSPSKMTTIRPRRVQTNDDYYNRQSSAYYNSDIQRFGNTQQYYHHLRLIWDEHGTDIEYTLRYNTSRPGFWLSSEPQRGEFSCFFFTENLIFLLKNHCSLR